LPRALWRREEDCVYRIVSKIVDDEVTVDKTTSTGTGPV
jgi:hypothetical protein